MNKEEMYKRGELAAEEAIKFGDYSKDELANEESYTKAIYETIENSKQYSDFAHLAANVNKCENSDELWFEWDRGIESKITKHIEEQRSKKFSIVFSRSYEVTGAISESEAEATAREDFGSEFEMLSESAYYFSAKVMEVLFKKQEVK
jgi:hypothetical protein